MKRILTAFIIYNLSFIIAFAQQHRIQSDDIASLEVMTGTDWLHIPVMKLHGGLPLNIGFDDLTHQYRRLRYDIQLLNYDFTPNEDLFKSEYLTGVTDQLYIDENQESLGTATLYTHYSLAIPNSDVSIKISGNYMLSVYDDNSDDSTPLLQVFFMVTDQSMNTGISYTTNTDIDVNSSYQQVVLKLGYGNRSVTDAENQIHTIVMQNNRWRTAVHNAKWDLRSASDITWNHCRDYIFPAGNEQHKFEFLDLHRTSMGVTEQGFDGKNYDVYVNTDSPRPNYVYDQSGQGAFLIRNTDNTEDEDYTTEYFVGHFSVDAKARMYLKEDDQLFLDGLWTRGSFAPEYQLTFNDLTKHYEAKVPLKMGYYSYQYLVRHSNGTVEVAPFEGNFYQTQNTYQALIYYRPVGGRSDLLVGYATTN